MMSDLGLLQSIVQSRRGDRAEFLNTAWTIQIIRGIVLAGVMLAVALCLGWAISNGWTSPSTVYGNKLLVDVLLVVAIVPVINGLESTRMYLANRRLQVRKIAMLEIVSQTAGLSVMIVIAWRFGNIWSLAIGVIITSVVRTILSHDWFPGEKHKLQLSKDSMDEIIHFGKWVLLSSLAGFVLNQGDRILLGGLVDAGQLGVYSIAYFLASAVLLGLGKLSRTVLFPILSKVAREEPQELKSQYYRLRARVDVVAFTVAGLLFISGTSIINFLYDPRYSHAGWMLEILGLSVIGVGSILSEQVFLATGNSKWLSVVTGIQTIFLYVGLPMAYSIGGLYAAVWVIALLFVPKYLLASWYLSRLKILSLKHEIRFIPFMILGGLTGMLVSTVLGLFNEQR